MKKPRYTFIDLSVPLANFGMEDPNPPSIVYYDHRDWARMQARNHGLKPTDFPGGIGLAFEMVTARTHSGTHMDAPFHYGPYCEGKPSKTVDQIPLDWCFGNGVRLDFTKQPRGQQIAPDDIRRALDHIGYRLEPFDIVLFWTGTPQRDDEHVYWERHPGVSREATKWLVDNGVKVVGIDAFGWDNPFSCMVEDFRRGKANSLWPSHFFGREREYCQIEKLTNLERISSPTGFKVAVFPILIERASAGWCRAVAILEE